MKNVLIVDDELGIRNVLSETLTDVGYVTDTAASAQDARQKMKSVKFDLVLLDIWMPGSDKDGLEFLDELIKQDNQIPVIMMSGHGSVDAATKATQNGAAAFLEKPITYKRLVETVEREINRRPPIRVTPPPPITRELNEADAKLIENIHKNKSTVPPRMLMGQMLPVFYLKQYNLTLDFNLPYRDVIQAVDKAYFETILRYVNYTVSTLAKHAGLERTHLYRKLKAIGISLSEIREEAQQGMYSRYHRPDLKTKGAVLNEVEPIINDYSLKCLEDDNPGSDLYQARRDYVKTHYSDIMNPKGKDDEFDDFFKD